MRSLVAAMAGAVLATAWVTGAGAETLTAATGYRVEYDRYAAVGREQPVALVFMHGKNGAHDARNLKTLAEKIARVGFTVYLPSMPWSKRWDGTVADATAALDALVALAAKDGKKVAVGGQSMGAAFALVYRAADPPPALIGKVLTSPGGLLDLTPPGSLFWKTITPSLERAKALEAAGKAKEKTNFGGANVVGTRSVEESYEMAPEVYLSFHDVARFPSVRAALAKTSLPVFWATGTRDPIGNAKRRTFEMIPANPASAYVELDGDHNSTMLVASDGIIAWLQARAAR
ncbi:MAG: alpha/beta hydrolase [Proteobacteria bacterium]|nr:alpha/beta hydrolase [Pseudomonadota bacterium]